MKKSSSIKLYFLFFAIMLINLFACEKGENKLAYQTGTSFKMMTLKGYSFVDATYLVNKKTGFKVIDFNKNQNNRPPVQVAFNSSDKALVFEFKNANSELSKNFSFKNNGLDTTLYFINLGDTILFNPNKPNATTGKMGLRFIFDSASTYTGSVDFEFHLMQNNNNQAVPAVSFVLTNIPQNKLTYKVEINKPSTTKQKYVVFVRKAGTTDLLPYTGSTGSTIGSFNIDFVENQTNFFVIQNTEIGNYSAQNITQSVSK